MIGGEARSLVGKGSTFATVIAGAPATSLAESGTSALPGLRALLGTLPVVGFRDGAVLVSWVSGSIFGPVSFPEFLGVVVVLSSGWDDSVSETDGWWGTSGNGSNECGDSSEFHDDRFIILLIINKCFIAINIIMAADTKLNINDFKLII